MVGVGAADTAPQVTIEAFEATGGAQVLARPGGMLFLQQAVGDRGAKVTPEGGDSGGLGVTVFCTTLRARRKTVLRCLA